MTTHPTSAVACQVRNAKPSRCLVLTRGAFPHRRVRNPHGLCCAPSSRRACAVRWPKPPGRPLDRGVAEADRRAAESLVGLDQLADLLVLVDDRAELEQAGHPGRYTSAGVLSRAPGATASTAREPRNR